MGHIKKEKMIQTDHRPKQTNFINLAMLALFLTTRPVALLAGSVQSGESGKDQSLIAALSVREEMQCVDTKYRDIEANVALTNTSPTDIVIKRGLGQNVTVLGLFGTRTLGPLLSSWMSASDQGPGSAATEVTVHPGETFAYRLQLRLNAEVLSQPGFYKIQVNYSAFRQALAGTKSIGGETNGAIIQVRECGESAALRQSSGNAESVDKGNGTEMSCQIPVPRALKDVTFTVVYTFEEKGGNPANIRKVKNDFLPDAKFKACMSRWTVPSMSKGVATFSRKPTEGWSTSVSVEGSETVDPRTGNVRPQSPTH